MIKLDRAAGAACESNGRSIASTEFQDRAVGNCEGAGVVAVDGGGD